ncbi:1,2-dihydroxy-3-keto-5-methylthiopentene dioxygenase 2-like [Camellia sinensis]|uniref:1,2-dihydroxy-3-keto-5-methylthiopentene dioxygenase 2-like n=1 Tax=Camellia sinensis TaxID=4442 RepID=UPI001036F057|nr:1,2-dihydroxy-3-keto-5-methylthiopentene dioxygenase 2-like [Camellia sinensis]
MRYLMRVNIAQSFIRVQIYLQDFCEVCPKKLPNYEEKIKNFFEEHLHTNEEIYYCVVGNSYFDVRDCNDVWIRVLVKKGVMIILLAGIYHRFTLDSNNYLKNLILYAMWLFISDPIWTLFNRLHDHLPTRVIRLQFALKGKEADYNSDWLILRASLWVVVECPPVINADNQGM